MFPRFMRVFNKRSQIWCPRPVKVSKDYAYIKDLQTNALNCLIEDPKIMQRSVVRQQNDPRNIRSTTAPISPQPVRELVEAHKSRLGEKLQWVREEDPHIQQVAGESHLISGPD